MEITKLAREIHILFSRPQPNFPISRNTNDFFRTMSYIEMLMLDYAEMDAIFKPSL